MTVEQLNVIVTAQTSDFEQKIAEVNNSLSRTIQLAEATAGKIAEISIAETDENAFAKNYAQRAAIDSDADTDSKPANAYEYMLGARANVMGLRRNETLMGVAAENESGGGIYGRPIEIHTTVELDGEKVGESVNMYNNERNKVLNGWG